MNFALLLFNNKREQVGYYSPIRQVRSLASWCGGKVSCSKARRHMRVRLLLLLALRRDPSAHASVCCR